MVKTFLILSLIFGGISGCSTMGKPKDIIYVDVPIIVCPAPLEIAPPILLTDNLSNEDEKDYEKITKAYVASLISLRYYTKTLEEQLEFYKGLKHGITDK